MKLHLTTFKNDEGTRYTEFSSSGDAASKARTRLKKAGYIDIATKVEEVSTTRTELIEFLNKRFSV